MKKIQLKVKKAEEIDMKLLEQLGAITRLLTPKDLSTVEEGKFGVRTVYATNPQYGGHKLIYVITNRTTSAVNSHPDNEDVLLINSGNPTKPLIFVFAKYPHKEMEPKIASNTLSHKDFIALDIPFNNPRMSFFTVNKDFPHYEVTTSGPGQAPLFWVTEPTNLPLIELSLSEYTIQLERGSYSSAVSS